MKIEEIENAIDEISGQFGIFYKVYLYRMYERMMLFLSKTKYSVYSEKNLSVNIVLDMLPELAELCSRTLLAIFYRIGDDRNYEDFYKKLSTQEEHNNILTRYPVLNKKIENFLKQRIEYIEESIIKFEMDKCEIIDCLGFSEKVLIENIKVTSGDTHNNGRKVIKFILNEGEILYKPRSLDPEHLFNEIQILVCGKGSMPTLKDVSRNEYSWQELARDSEAESYEEVRAYFYKSGQLLFLLDMFNSHDVHRENIIARRDGPVCIDMETLIDSGSKKIRAGDGPLKYVNTECINSVIGTLLLPTNCLHMVFDFDISALSGNAQHKSEQWYDYVFVDQGKDTIRLEKTYIMGIDEEETNRLFYKGEAVNPQDYVNEIISGFENAYKNFCDCKEEIIMRLTESKIRIRQVLRPTAVYGKFLQASLYETYLTNEDNYKKLFEMFRGKEYDAKNKYEIDDLVNRDVPFFYSVIDEKNLCSHRGEERDYFERSALSVVLDKIANMDLKYIEKQEYYIHLALSTLDNSSGVKHRLKIFKENMSPEQMVELIAKKIEDRMFWNIEKTDGFLLTTADVKGRKCISMLDYNLYDGGGILLFIAALYYVTKEKKYLEITKGLFNACISTKAINGFKEIGVFVGKMSYVYIYYFLYKYVGFNQCRQLIEDVCSDIIDTIDTNVKEYDIISGLAGIVICAANIFKDNICIDKIEKLLIKASQLLYDKCDTMLKTDEVKTGFAHGLSGVALAMYKAYEYLGDERYFQMAIRCINKEDESYDKNADNWIDHRDNERRLSYWCYGAAGIALSRKLMNQDYHNSMQSIDAKFGDNHSLCHGQWGNLAIMEILGVDEYNLEKKREKLIFEMKNSGVLFGNSSAIEDYSFMQGLCGIGYELLRMSNKKLPNILILDV